MPDQPLFPLSPDEPATRDDALREWAAVPRSEARICARRAPGEPRAAVFTCDRPAGHPGRHVAIDRLVIVARWAEPGAPGPASSVPPSGRPLTDAEALAETYLLPRPRWCRAPDPDQANGYYCTRPQAHLGEHVACNERDVLSRWASEPGAPGAAFTEPPLTDVSTPRACPSTVVLGDEDYDCDLTFGHPGDRVDALWSGAEPRWPNDADTTAAFKTEPGIIPPGTETYCPHCVLASCPGACPDTIESLPAPPPAEALRLRYLAVARELWANDEVAVDDDATISLSSDNGSDEDGAWVQAWVFVHGSELEAPAAPAPTTPLSSTVGKAVVTDAEVIVECTNGRPGCVAPNLLGHVLCRCSRDAGHPGEHAATDGVVVLARWPAAPNPLTDAALLAENAARRESVDCTTCSAIDPATSSYCTRPRGHASVHAACALGEVVARWEPADV